jgi:hypothetical protein
MKRLIFVLAIICLPILKTASQELTTKEKFIFDNYFKSKLTYTSDNKKIVSDTLSKVFSDAIYSIQAGFLDGEGGYTYNVVGLYTIKGDLPVKFNIMDLLPAIRSDFSLKDESDAKVFETALDKIKPPDWSNKKYKEHLKIDNKWYFVRGKFFDSKSAYIVTIDQSGKITKIDYNDEAIKK